MTAQHTPETPADPADPADARGARQPQPHPPAEVLPGSVQHALLSLQASRAALRQAMKPAPEPAPAGQRPAAALARLWWRRLRRWPAARVAGEVAQQWWQRHPWRPLGDTLLAGARSELLPLVRRHPWATVGLAAGAGALAVASRPWRWSWLGQRVRRAPAAASHWLIAQLRAAPVQAALAGLLTLAVQQSLAADAPHDGAASGPAPDPASRPASRTACGADDAAPPPVDSPATERGFDAAP